MGVRGHTGLAVLEARWWKEGNTSVRPLFDVFADLQHSNTNSYSYDMFYDERSLAINLRRLSEIKKTRYIYLSCHGSKTELHPSDESSISRSVLRNRIVETNDNLVLKGLYLGSCLAGGHYQNYMLDKSTNLRWVAGYNSKVNWINSSAFDLLFFNTLLNVRRRQGAAGHEDAAVKDVAKALNQQVGGLMRKLKFSLAVRRSNGQIESLIGDS